MPQVDIGKPSLYARGGLRLVVPQVDQRTMLLQSTASKASGSRQSMANPSCAKATVAVPGPHPISRILEEGASWAALTALLTSSLG
jgi:hypothetical protein